jgi:TetR/AcrR family transcriptional repressor of mexCD-oprJ operon
LKRIEISGDPRVALARLLGSSWRIVNRHRMLLRAAEHTVGPERIRDHHERPLRRVERLLARGRREGAFRTDLPTAWLAATFYSVLHGTADEIAAGRFADRDAGHTITATLIAAFTPPGRPVSQPPARR